MTAVAYWFRLDARRRWRSLLVLTLLIAVAAGTVMTAAAGARRGGTAVDRLLEQTSPATVVAQPNQPGFDWDAVRQLPEVKALGTFALTDQYVIDEVPRDAWIGRYPVADDEMLRTIERPVVLEGRLLNADRADEVVVGPRFRDTFGLGVGDTLTLRLYAPQTLDELVFSGDATEVEPDGPVVEARIVGVVRSPAQLLSGDEAADSDGGLLTSPALFEQYTPNVLGASGEGLVNAAVRLRGGANAIPDFKEGLERVTGRSDIGVWDLTAEARHARDVTDFEADALLVFATAAGVAALFLVGQAVVRYAAATVADLQTLRAVGMTPRLTAVTSACAPLIAAVVGSLFGVIVAVAASLWFPIGTAAQFEPAPGLDVDAAVLVAGLVAGSILVAAGTAGASLLALRASRSSSPRRSVVAAAATRAGAPVPVVVGTRFALEPGHGRHAVPVRPALIGAVVGTLGVLAAFMFSAGVEDAADHPERFGQVHELEALVGFEGEDGGPVDELLPEIAADPAVAAVNDARVAVAEAGDMPVPLYTLDPVDARWEPVVVEGRAPDGPDEVALAPASAEAIGASVGDTVQVTGTLGVRDLTVSGLAFVPEFPSHNTYVTGGWVSAVAYDQLFDPASSLSPAFKFHLVHVALQPGADAEAVAARIEAALGAGEMFSQPGPPSPLAELRQVRMLPVFLAAFLAVLALGAVGHALATAVRRRRHDVAVLRALGMTRIQARGAALTQATVLALLGLLIGMPLGVALGRMVWRYVADTTPLFYVPPAAALALWLIVPIALLAATLLAAWPGHRAASMRVGHVLRTE
ncbi:ABC transporter permease [Phytoactinopolyspora halotolerans]|uniref:ABC transporter permease n=1 Tax=Phytoactinopolyspora halotolerans TaxID=1981512 RepID=A0A6L9S4C0_9ACTN|nr:ABC transporter permease [Phytoactinopolyspora halotolerans]NED99928.1 ABC transporter permease [Phytoactinopolyspora halotolerans]